uniref:Uncharacterized protein n=1 Tax=Araucaria cunninghamii TaxID=56994 RepID=A0A0D6QSC1_ARACU
MSKVEVPATLHKRLEGKVAIITGGASGIGAATVRLFAKHGAKVIIADIADQVGKKLAESLSPDVTYVHCDVSKEQDVRAVVDLAMQKYGQLDIMFNNAGVSDTYRGSIAEYPMEQFEHVIDVDVKGIMHGMKHAARVMIPSGRGSIISTASIAGIIGGISPYTYTTAKHAVIGLTKNCAAELGKYGIRVNAISPYGVATPLTVQVLITGEYSPGPISKEDEAKVEALFNNISNLKGVTLKAHDIAESALYLAGEDAKYVSGHNLVVDGGFSVVNHEIGLY